MTPPLHDSAKLLKHVIESVVTVVSVPNVYFKLVELDSTPNVSVAHFARLLSEDPGLSARILRVVNSAHYGFRSKVETVERAITILGVNELYDLVLATSVVNHFKNIPQSVVTMDSFWRHSVACGLAAKALATEARLEKPDRFFVAGLMHDVGRLVLFMQLPALSQQAICLAREKNILLYAAERQVLGFDHGTLGGMLFSKWGLPPMLTEAIKYHHNPRHALGFTQEASILHCADILANALQLGSSGEVFVPPLEESAWQSLKLSPKIIPFVLDEVEALYEETLATLSS
jgi:HD-like signal output (HDOD) protein